MMVRLVLTLAALGLLHGLFSPARAQIFGDRPDAIVCPVAAVADRPGGQVVFHLVWRDDNAITYYAAMGMQPFRLQIDADGVVQAPKLKGCDGKTIEQLRESGRAFFFS